MSGLAPSAAIVRAVRQAAWAPGGNLSKSLRAALIHEIGRVFLVIGYGRKSQPLGTSPSYVVKYDNISQGRLGCAFGAGLRLQDRASTTCRSAAPARRPSPTAGGRGGR